MGELVAFPSRPEPERAKPEPLWREAVGHELREERRTSGRTLADVAQDAGMSTQYLSEIERGRKEPSSEMLGAVAGALGLRLVDLTTRVSERLTRIDGPVCLAA
jgi:transcriptional regulator with XRE-family HTH domain